MTNDTNEVKIPREGTTLETFVLSSGEELHLKQTEAGPSWRNKNGEAVTNPHRPIKAEKMDAETRGRLKEADAKTKEAVKEAIAETKTNVNNNSNKPKG